MKFILIPSTAFLIAQIIKVVLIFVKQGNLRADQILWSVGMPSSHAALLSALTLTIGESSGFDSSIFALALFFSIAYLCDIMLFHKLASKKLRSMEGLIGHSPSEIFIGILIGLLSVKFLIFDL